jgi:hypothetical protein
MAITPDDIRLFRSARPTDFDDGGGRMSSVVIVDGLDNNLFDDITDFDRIAGRVSLRKIFGQVLSENDDAFLSAYAFLDTAPTDAASDACLFAVGGLTTERLDAVESLEATYARAGQGWVVQSVELGVMLVWVAGSTGMPLGLTAGDTLSVFKGASAGASFFVEVTGFGAVVTFNWVEGSIPQTAHYRQVLVSGATSSLDGELDGFGGPAGSHRAYRVRDGLQATRTFGVATVDAALEDDTALTASGTTARVVPWDGVAAYPTEADGIDPAPFEAISGAVRVLRTGDPVLIHHTASTTPAAVADLDVVNVSRTDLARLEVIGSDGTVHARFDANAPAPTGVGCTADLAAGTVTISDVSGYAQPVSIRHRIEELAAIASISGVTVTLNRGLSRDYPSGTKISSLLRLGDRQGRVEGGFAQQAWTGVWADAVTGGSPLADFNDVTHPIVTTNKGAVEERWALIFTGTTTFRCIGEALGEVGTGNVGADCSPLNPATGAPLFTVPSLGWGTGWVNGNVYRFNTVGANAPIWVLRSVAPSLPGGDDSVVVEFRGYVNT